MEVEPHTDADIDDDDEIDFKIEIKIINFKIVFTICNVIYTKGKRKLMRKSVQL